MRIKKKYLISLLALACAVFVTGLYANGEFAVKSNEGNSQNVSLSDHLRDPHKLLSQSEKARYLTLGYQEDLRPVQKVPVKAKGIYMSGHVFNHKGIFTNLVDLVDTTELNAIVIDMKDDNGYLTADLDVQLAKELKTKVHKGMNAQQNMQTLADKNIYPIARIVVFKDPYLAENKPELALRKSDGTLWRDRKKLAWVDPNNRTVWEYNINIAKEAAKMGFREIQFDYVRFPTDGDMSDVIYPYADGNKKEDVIHNFLIYAKKELEPYNVYIAADVFGLTTMTLDDMGMGQKFEKIMTEVDYICPMVYPSHYGVGNYGFSNPNAHPYEIVNRALLDGLKKKGDLPVVIRPWLQDFKLGRPAYGAAEVRAQIKATYDAGLEEWILWNAGNKYTRGALLD